MEVILLQNPTISVWISVEKVRRHGFVVTN